MNNQFIPNTSSIPNVLFDYWMEKLTPAEFKVLMCIARKTYGWHKEYDRISLNQIEKMTGMSRRGVITNIDVLTNLGLVDKIKSKTLDGDDAPNQYEINIFCIENNTLGGVNCMGGGSELTSLGVVNSVHQGVVNSVHPQKKTYTKENIQITHPTLAGSDGVGVVNSSLEKKSKETKKPKGSIVADIPKDVYCENILLSKEEHAKLLEMHGAEQLNSMFEILSSYIGSSGKQYKSHFHVLNKGGWVFKRLEQDRAENVGLKKNSEYKRYGKMVISADTRAVPTERQHYKPKISDEEFEKMMAQMKAMEQPK